MASVTSLLGHVIADLLHFVAGDLAPTQLAFCGAQEPKQMANRLDGFSRGGHFTLLNFDLVNAPSPILAWIAHRAWA